MNLKQLDAKFLARDEDADDIEVLRTDGPYVFDAKGKRHIDFLAGWCVGNFGWGNKEIRRRIARFKGPDYVYPYYRYAPWAELAELIADMAPGELQKTYRATGGSEAVEIALQVAMAYTGRRKFVSIEGSYHGNTIGAVSVASSESRETFPSLLSNCLKVSPPLQDRAAERVERLLRKRDVAAFIMEPISCNLGVLVPSQEFMSRVKRACKRSGTLFIADEVACGFGRTGALFASEHFGIEPDIMCMAKALSGGYAPIGATITTEKIANAVRGKASFWSTFGWHPIAVAASIANLRWVMRNYMRLMKNVDVMSEHFRERLSSMKFREEPEIRIKGLAIAVDVGDSDYAEGISEKCRRKGLLLTTSDEALTIFPPLNVDHQTVSEAMDIMERCLR